jgi:hypothetical protein
VVGYRLAIELVWTVALVSSPGDLVEIRLRHPVRVWLGALPQRCSRLHVSLEEPERFIDALDSAIERGG